MAKLNASRILQVGVLLIVCIASILLGYAMRDNEVVAGKTPSKQSQEKVITRKEDTNEPFELSNLSVKNVEIGLHQKFDAFSLVENGGGQAEDWLENLKFTIKNKSGKQMTYINLDLVFPETEIIGGRILYDINLGLPPKAILGNTKMDGTPLTINPNDVFIFTLSDRQLKVIKQGLSLKGFQLANLTKVIIVIDYIIFDDGMKWQQGLWYKQNPDGSNKYLRVDQ